MLSVNNIFNDQAYLEKAGVKFLGPSAKVATGLNKSAYAIYFTGFDDYRFELLKTVS